MKTLKEIIIEKLKISSNSKVIGELDNFDNFAKKYDGEFSKGVILFNENKIFGYISKSLSSIILYNL